MPTERQGHDHRLRELVTRTNDPKLAERYGVPRSTARSWIRRGSRPVVSCPEFEEPTEVMPGTRPTKRWLAKTSCRGRRWTTWRRQPGRFSIPCSRAGSTPLGSPPRERGAFSANRFAPASNSMTEPMDEQRDVIKGPRMGDLVDPPVVATRVQSGRSRGRRSCSPCPASSSSRWSRMRSTSGWRSSWST